MQSIYNLVGIAQRAGKVSSGAVAVQTSLAGNQARVLLMSKDISLNTREAFILKCRQRNIPWFILGDRYDLGKSLGKAYRVALTINDAGLAGAIIKAIEDADEEVISTGVVEWSK